MADDCAIQRSQGSEPGAGAWKPTREAGLEDSSQKQAISVASLRSVYIDRKGVGRKIILLAPVNQEGLLADVLTEAKLTIKVKGDPKEESEPRTEWVRMIAPPVVPRSAAPEPI